MPYGVDEPRQPGPNWVLAFVALIGAAMATTFVISVAFISGLFKKLWEIHPLIAIGTVVILFLMGTQWATSFGGP